MNILQKINEDIINLMKKDTGILAAWEFGSGMYHTRDEYSDIDLVLLAQESDYKRIHRQLQNNLEAVCDHVLIFWPEDFNESSIYNYDCLLEQEGEILQYDVFLLNDGALDDEMCKIHYANLQTENIYFDKIGKATALINNNQSPQTWSDDICRLIDTYWLHIHMSAKYFLRKDYFKLDSVLRILMETHSRLLLTLYDRITWGGVANKLHYLPKEKQEHLKHYYCDKDFLKTKENLWQEMLWFEDDLSEFECAETVARNKTLSDKIKKAWRERLLPHKEVI